MLLKCFNRALINDREKTYLTTAAVAGDTDLDVADTDLAPDALSSNTWADNDYMMVGEPGDEKTEIMQLAAAVTLATNFATIDREGEAGGLRLSHPIGTPIYRIDYNQVTFYHGATDTTTGLAALTTINLQPDDEFTRYDDTANSTGYGFARFYNATTGAYSSYSDGVNYEEAGIRSSRDPRTKWTLRKKVRQLLDEDEPDSKLTDSMVDEALNDKQREIAHERLWSFYEFERSFSAVANQFAYTLPSTVQMVHGVKAGTQPVGVINKADWDLKHFDTDMSSDTITNFCPWDRQILLYPRPASAANTDAIDDAAGITATDTSVTVDDSSGFTRGDYYRFIIDSEVIYATAATATSFTGLLRGREGTTAAAHLDNAVITERDVVYSCHVEPDDLIETQDRTAIPEPEVLTYGTAVDLAPFVGKEALIPIFEAKYNKRIEDLKNKYSSKQTAQFGRVKDMSEVLQSASGLRNPNDYPTNLS